MTNIAVACLLVVSGIATHFVPSGNINKLIDDLVTRDGKGTFIYMLQLLVACLPQFIRFR